MSMTSSISAQARDLALISTFAALIGVLAVMPAIPVGPLGVPITLQTLGVYLTALILGGRRATAAVGLYILAGLLGLPIFAGGKAGLAIFASPSVGYLLGFLPAAALTGFLAYRALGQGLKGRELLPTFTVAALLGVLLIHLLGMGGMVIVGGLEPSAALLADVIYLPGDFLKAGLALLLALRLHAVFPALHRR